MARVDAMADQTKTPTQDEYALKSSVGDEFPAPDLPYLPRRARRTRPKIALVGTGGIAPFHLRAYAKMGFEVVALCNRTPKKAEALAKEFFPPARVVSDASAIWNDDTIEVVDILTHPNERVELIADALQSGKHVLSQKPFVTDLGVGEELCDLADRCGRRLAVNQNGRFAAHFSYIRAALGAGLLGDLVSTHFRVHWNHGWIADTPFQNIPAIILWDFAIHWFDLTAHLWGEQSATRVWATSAKSPGQTTLRPPMLAQALVEFPRGQGSLVFDALLPFGARDESYIGGTRGSIETVGPDLNAQAVTLYTAQGFARPKLEGDWFGNGFEGAMGELLCAVEENREPTNNARANLKSLALSFAAVASSLEGTPKIPGEVRALPAGALSFGSDL